MLPSVLGCPAVVDHRLALLLERATAIPKLRNSADVPLSRLLHPKVAVALARAPGTLILSLGVVDPFPLDDDAWLPPTPSDAQFPSPQHDVDRPVLLVVLQLQSVRHLVERFLLLVADVPIRLSLLRGDASLLPLFACAQLQPSLPRGVFALRHSPAAYELLRLLAIFAELTAALTASVQS